MPLRRLDEHGVRNVSLEIADAMAVEITKTYDAIAVTASSPRRIRRFEKALKPGGRLFMIVGDAPAMEALLITRVERLDQRKPVRNHDPPLINAEQPSRFHLLSAGAYAGNHADNRRRNAERAGKCVLLDVREPWELRIAAIAGALHIPMQDVPDRLAELDPGRDLVVFCHHGNRSRVVARYLEQNGYPGSLIFRRN